MLHIDTFLRDRYPRFVSRHKRVAKLLARFLGLLFYESRFQQFERDYPHLRGYDFVEQTLRYFDFSLRVCDRELERIPASGRVVIVSNHPIGSLDGLALLNMVRRVRPDVKAVANELLMAIEPLKPVLLPVHNMGGGTPRANLKRIHAHLEAEGALIIFPAGEVSRFGPRGVRDGEWNGGFLKMARKSRAPVLPVFVSGRNSLFFYSLSMLARPISTVWLVREMFKQSSNRVVARVGNPITYDVYGSLEVSTSKLAALFRKHVYRIARDGRPIFQSVQTVAHPENRVLLRREVEASELLGESADGKRIYLCTMEQSPCVMRELGRLRELTFRTVGEGTGRSRDIDRFDAHYLQLVLWDPVEMEIAGGYRLGQAAKILAEKGLDGLYTNTLFRFCAPNTAVLEQGLELGRSFVQPRYQKRGSLDYLWAGLGAYIKRYPGYRYLFGPASISPYYGRDASAQIARFYSTHYPLTGLSVQARRPFEHPLLLENSAPAGSPGAASIEEDYETLQQHLKAAGLSVPTLFKHYSKALKPGGLSVGAFNVDPDFGGCVDGLLVADLQLLTNKKKHRYLGIGAEDDASARSDRACLLRDTMDI